MHSVELPFLHPRIPTNRQSDDSRGRSHILEHGFGTFAKPLRYAGMRSNLIGNGIESDAFFGSLGRIVEVAGGAIAKQRPYRNVPVGGRARAED